MIKCFIIAALTLDGHIAKEVNHAALWTSKEDKKRFVELTKRAGVVVMGENTYKTLQKPLKERVNIVYTNQTFEGVESTQDSPVELLKKLDARGFKEVAICGGQFIYTTFMKARVVDTLYLTVEPVIFGKGMHIFNDDMLFHLKLISSGQTDGGALLLEYKVEYQGNPKVEPGVQ